MTPSSVYLDHNASAPLLPEARRALLETLELEGNPASVHAHGRRLAEAVEAARTKVAVLAGATRQQVVFTGSATEAIHQAILAGGRTLGVHGLVVGAGEHPAVLAAAEATGLPLTRLPLQSDGTLALDPLCARLTAAEAAGETLLVAVQAVNNETGVIQPLADVARLVGPTRHYLFVDAVQAFGRLPLDFAASAADMMAVSGHKLGAPVGVGALLMKSHCDDVRLLAGGGHEQGRRAGTQAAALIAAFGAAAEAFPARYEAAGVSTLRERLETGLFAIAEDFVVFGAAAERVGNTSNFAVPGLGNAVAMMGLDLLGVSVSSGSACSSGKVGRSHVLAAMGVPEALAGAALRASLGWNTTERDVDAFLDGFATVLSRHRRRRGEAA